MRMDVNVLDWIGDYSFVPIQIRVDDELVLTDLLNSCAPLVFINGSRVTRLDDAMTFRVEPCTTSDVLAFPPYIASRWTLPVSVSRVNLPIYLNKEPFELRFSNCFVRRTIANGWPTGSSIGTSVAQFKLTPPSTVDDATWRPDTVFYDDGKLPPPFDAAATVAAMSIVFDGDCAVCLEEKVDAVKTSCAHTFHSDCLLRWLRARTTCPLCRFDLNK